MDKRGLPVQLSVVAYLAQLLLSARLSSQSITIGGHWVNRYIKRHPELKSKYTRKYDYQRAKCENPKLIQAWFARVQETIQKYGILAEDIYNMDETGFQMGVASTAKVVCGFETKQSNAKALQPGNREWVTAIVAANATGWVLPAQIIFAAVRHHATAEFDRFCMEKRIIPLYMPPHSSHLLQPLLDVSCFSPLKHLYGQRIQEKIQKGIYSIGKEDFIHIYPEVHQQALSLLNIKSGFAATGLIPFSPERVLSKF